MTDELKEVQKLEKIAASTLPAGLKLIRSLSVSIAKKPKTTAEKKSAIDKAIEREYGKVNRRKARKTVAVDNYIIESAPETTTSESQRSSIKKLLDESHYDVKQYLNENKVISYKSTADGLFVKLENGINLQMVCLAKNAKKYTIIQRGRVLLTTVVDSPYVLKPKQQAVQQRK